MSDNFNEQEAAQELERMESNTNQSTYNMADSMSDSISQQGLGSVNMNRFNRQQAQSADIHMGWVDVNLNDLPSKGMFYPSDCSMKIRSAKAAEIRHFSTMDESNFLDMEEKLNGIIESCSMMTSSSVKMSYKDICEEDRIVVLLKIQVSFNKI